MLRSQKRRNSKSPNQYLAKNMKYIYIILQLNMYIIGKQNVTQSRTDLEIFRQGVDGLARGLEAHSAAYDSGNFKH